MRWVEWVEPFVGNDAVYMRVTEEVAIKAQRKAGEKLGHTYVSDEEALADFMTVNWASFVEERT